MEGTEEVKVVSPISLNGEVIKNGTVELTEKQIKRFVAMGEKDCPIRPLDYEPIAESSATPNGAGTPPANAEPPQPVTEARIIEAITQLDPNDPGNWTSGQKPQVSAIEEILGADISAAERDAAWAAHQASAQQ